jgi:hypothetical protein
MDGPALVPYSWEVYWTVQLVENGELKDTYYGGHNSAMSFAYSHLSRTFSPQQLSEVWQPGLDMNCSGAVSSFESRVYDSSGPGRAFSAASETTAAIAGAGYLDATWFITDNAVCITVYLTTLLLKCMLFYIILTVWFVMD